LDKVLITAVIMSDSDPEKLTLRVLETDGKKTKAVINIEPIKRPLEIDLKPHQVGTFAASKDGSYEVVDIPERTVLEQI